MVTTLKVITWNSWVTNYVRFMLTRFKVLKVERLSERTQSYTGALTKSYGKVKGSKCGS